jgi:hypothetical protein
MWTMMEMTNGTKYRVLIEFDDLVNVVNRALKEGGMLTVPMGIKAPGTPYTINPQHIVALDRHAS